MAKLLALAGTVSSLLLLLWACSSAETAAPGRPADLAARWILLEIPGAGDLLPEEAAWRPWLQIDADGAVGGHTGVNHLSSQLDSEGLAAGRFELGPIVTTRMAGSPEAMELEQRLTEDLGRAERYRLGDGSLELLAGGEVLLRFARAG